MSERSVNLTHFFLGRLRLRKWLTITLCTYFASNWLLPLLNQQKEKRKYRKNSKIWDTSNNCHNCPKIGKVWCNIALMHPKDADGMANRVDPDQTASSEAVWSWSALFAETYFSQYIEFLRYVARPGIEPRTSDLRVRCHTDCTTRLGWL